MTVKSNHNLKTQKISILKSNLFLGAKAPLELAHVKKNKNKDENGTENFGIA